MKRIIRKILKEEFNNRISREGYLDKVVEYLVDDTIIDYEEREIKYPHLPPSSFPSFFYTFPPSLFHPHHFLSFSEYCQVTYGLTENEMDYVWDRYKNIIWDRYKNIKLGKINEGF